MPPTLHLNSHTGTITLTNGALALTVETRPYYNPRRLHDTDGNSYAPEVGLVTTVGHVSGQAVDYTYEMVLVSYDIQ